jgi:hypothetical protein
VFSHGLGEVYVAGIDSMQKNEEVSHRPSMTRQLALSLQLDAEFEGAGENDEASRPGRQTL